MILAIGRAKQTIKGHHAALWVVAEFTQWQLECIAKAG
jgi:hypothetical protein